MRDGGGVARRGTNSGPDDQAWSPRPPVTGHLLFTPVNVLPDGADDNSLHMVMDMPCEYLFVAGSAKGSVL